MGWIITALALLAMTVVYADVDQDDAIKLLQQGEIHSLEQIIDIAKRYQAGKIIDMELDEDDGVFRYELEILDVKGLVWEVDINAKTGELIERELED